MRSSLGKQLDDIDDVSQEQKRVSGLIPDSCRPPARASLCNIANPKLLLMCTLITDQSVSVCTIVGEHLRLRTKHWVK